MDFNNIFDKLKNRIWTPTSDFEMVEMIEKAYISETIDDDEKELLLDLL